VALPKDSPPSAILALVRSGKVEGFLSPFILDELEKNLHAKSGWNPDRLIALRKNLKTSFSIVNPTTQINVIKRVPADNRILECAVDAGADVLISGNMKDIRPLGNFQGIRILTPREFLQTYFPDQK
jgi:predicted nucleic acid-binding protein